MSFDIIRKIISLPDISPKNSDKRCNHKSSFKINEHEYNIQLNSSYSSVHKTGIKWIDISGNNVYPLSLEYEVARYNFWLIISNQVDKKIRFDKDDIKNLSDFDDLMIALKYGRDLMDQNLIKDKDLLKIFLIKLNEM